MENFDGLLKFFNIFKSSIQSTQIQHFHKCMYLYFKYIFMLTIRFWPCPKCTFIRLYTTLNLKACKINNASGASPSRKKCVTFLRGGGSPERRPYEVSRGQNRYVALPLQERHTFKFRVQTSFYHNKLSQNLRCQRR